MVDSKESFEDEINGRTIVAARLFNAIKSKFLGKKKMGTSADKSRNNDENRKPTLTHTCES